MGFPLEDVDLKRYLSRLKESFKALHAAQVVHMDAFPSNILWRNVAGEIVIRFVDLDVSSFVGYELDSGIHERLCSRRIQDSCHYWNETESASPKHDAWFMFVFKEATFDERVKCHVAALEKNPQSVHLTYTTLVARLLATRTKADLVNDFNDWLSVAVRRPVRPEGGCSVLLTMRCWVRMNATGTGDLTRSFWWTHVLPSDRRTNLMSSNRTV